MKSNQYWKDRANERMAEYHKNSDKTIFKINNAYDKAIEDINNDINKIFYKFATDGDLSEADARILLNSKIPKKELDEIRAKINFIEDSDLKKYLMSQLNADAYKARITRLEALKESIYINTKKAADVELQQSQLGYINNIKESYYRNIYDIQKGTGIVTDFATLPVNAIEEILKNNWSGKHYSERVWGNSDVLASKLEEVVTSGLMSGKSSKKMAAELEELSTYGKMAAERLVRTETTYVTNMAELESYKELDIDKYIFVATLDLRTSPMCREMDGKIIEVSKGAPGENLPPLHPWCRSTTRAYFEGMTRRRRARDPETGKNYTVEDMDYKEWYQKYVEKEEINLSHIDKINGCNSIEELNKTSLSALKKYGIENIDFTGCNLERGKEILSQCYNLINEYNTDPIREIVMQDKIIGGGKAVGVTVRGSKENDCIIQLKESDNKKYIMLDKYKNKKSWDGIVNFDVVVDADNANISTITHEFAHTFGDSKQNYNNEFWKEIKSVRNQYSREMKKISKSQIVDKTITYEEAIMMKNKIFISEYAETSIDEFMAEAFTEAKLSSSPSPYSEKVLEVVDKHFKKDSIINPNSDIIKEARNDSKSFTVNREYINSENYISKFDNIGSKKQNLSVCKETKNAIKRNDGKSTEAMSILDKNGNVLTKQSAGSFGGNVDLSCIDKLPNNSVVLTHNHPLSTSFSGDDLAILMDNPQIKTIIAGGHDGTVYKLSIGKGTRAEMSELTGRNTIIQEYNMLLRELKHPNNVVMALVNKYKWKYEVI